MDDRGLLKEISALVAEEHHLRGQPDAGLDDQQRKRLDAVERQLDQCWDLLRRRRGREEFGNDPDLEKARPEGEVESYLQ